MTDTLNSKSRTATIRFAEVSDFGAVDAVYRERFPEDLSVDDSVYFDILNRGGYVRIIEVIGSSTIGTVSGFYTFWPISTATYAKLKSGKILERSFTSADIVQFNDADAEVLYVPEMAISRTSDLGPLLVRDALVYACSILLRFPNFKLISAWGYSDVGKSIAVRLGMQRALDSLPDEPYYEMSADEARKRCPRRSFVQTRKIALSLSP